MYSTINNQYEVVDVSNYLYSLSILLLVLPNKNAIVSCQLMVLFDPYNMNAYVTKYRLFEKYVIAYRNYMASAHI